MRTRAATEGRPYAVRGRRYAVRSCRGGPPWPPEFASARRFFLPNPTDTLRTKWSTHDTPQTSSFPPTLGRFPQAIGLRFWD